MITRLVVSLALAALAFGLPWLTHFADRGLSIAVHLSWIGLAIETLVRHGSRGAWLLLAAPLALFWPVSLAIVALSGDLHFGF